MSDDGGTEAVPAAALKPDAGPLDTGLVSLAMLAQFFEKPADVAQLSHEYAPDGEPVDEVQLLRAAKSLGFKAKAMDLKPERVDKAPLPVIGQWMDEEIEVVNEAHVEVPALPAGLPQIAENGPAKVVLGQIGSASPDGPDTPATTTKTIVKPGGFFILAKAQTGPVELEDGSFINKTRVLIQDPAQAAHANGIAEMDLDAFTAKFSGRIVAFINRDSVLN